MSAIVVIEELARRGTFAGRPFIHCAFYGSLNISENGSEAQKRELLPRLARGEILFAYGLSEPDVGGDLASGTRDGQRSSHGRQQGHHQRHEALGAPARASPTTSTTLVRSGAEGRPLPQPLASCWCRPRAPGSRIVDIDHIGLRYAATTDVIFDDVEVPAENIVGGPEGWNKGWRMLAGPRPRRRAARDHGRRRFGIAAAAVEDAWRYAQERAQFGKPICAPPGGAPLLVDARTKLQACRHMLYHAAWLANEGAACSVESSMAKLFIGDTAVEIVLDLPAGDGRLWLRARLRHGALRARHRRACRSWAGSSNMQKQQHRQPPRAAGEVIRLAGKARTTTA